MTASAVAGALKMSHRVAATEAMWPGANVTNGSREHVHVAPAEPVEQIRVSFVTPLASTIDADRLPVTSRSLSGLAAGRAGFAPIRTGREVLMYARRRAWAWQPR